MGADDGADLREGQIVRRGGLVGGRFLGGFRLRQAVGDVLAGRRVGQARVGHPDGPREVDAAGLVDLLEHHVFRLLRSARLAEHHDVAIDDAHHGLDGEHAAHKGRRSGNAAAAAQVLQCIQRGHEPDVLLLLVEAVGDVGGGKPFVAQSPGALGQDALADGGVLAVDHEHRLLERGRGDAGALVGAGDVAGKRDADDLVAGIDGLLEEVLEHHGRDLARAGQLVGFYEALEELLARKVDALGVLFGAECDGHGDDGNVVGAGVALFHVRRRVHDDANGHNASLEVVSLILSSVRGASARRRKGK